MIHLVRIKLTRCQFLGIGPSKPLKAESLFFLQFDSN